jgi:hypothetical protein
MSVERLIIVALCLVALLNLGVAWIWKREAERWRRLALQHALRRSERRPTEQRDVFAGLEEDSLQAHTTRAVRTLLRFTQKPPAPEEEKGPQQAERT